MDYLVTFPNAGLTINNENLVELKAPRFDPVTGDRLNILFGMVTTKGPACEIELAKLLKDINDAGVNTHTYDAKSGTGLRITRICVTDERLLKFAEAIEFQRSFVPEKIKAAAVAKGLVLKNPDTPEGRKWCVRLQLWCNTGVGDNTTLCFFSCANQKL
jgi:hypothetical protein